MGDLKRSILNSSILTSNGKRFFVLTTASYPDDGDHQYNQSKGAGQNHNATAFLLSDCRFPIGCTRFNGRHLMENPPEFVNEACKSGKLALVQNSCVVTAGKMDTTNQRGSWFLHKNGRCIDSKTQGFSIGIIFQFQLKEFLCIEKLIQITNCCSQRLFAALIELLH